MHCTLFIKYTQFQYHCYLRSPKEIVQETGFFGKRFLWGLWVCIWKELRFRREGCIYEGVVGNMLHYRCKNATPVLGRVSAIELS